MVTMATCPTEHSNVSLTFGIILSLGTIISFIPQYYKIITNGNVKGISHWTQGLNNISSFCAFFGAFMLDYYLFKCCYSNGGCGYLLIPFIQLFMNWICPLINYLIYMNYFKAKNTKEIYKVYGFFAFYVIIFLICSTLTSIVLTAKWYSWQSHATIFGNILNVLSTVVTAFVWIPQILETYRSKDVGSLSLISLGIQTPGSFTIFIYQVAITKSSWYIGIPYLVASIFQGIVLSLGIMYRKRRQSQLKRVYAYYNEDNVDMEFVSDNDMDEDAELITTSDTVHQVYQAYDTLSFNDTNIQ
jgi:uncharacterized protein with PQ loop repeat